MAIDAAAMDNGLPMFAQTTKDVDVGYSMRVTCVGAKMNMSHYGVFTLPKHIPGGQCALSVSAVTALA
jgi:hypothetical protein